MAQQALTTIMEEKDKKERLNQTLNPLPKTDLAILIATITDDPEDYLWINARSTNATTIQAEINLKKPTVPLKDQIPKEFHEFSKKSAAQFPEPRSWDDKIELKDTFVLKSFKTYNLTLAEQIELDNFLKGNLDKGYIRPSGFTLLLCQQKGWKITTMLRLPIHKWAYSKKCIPTSIDKWIVGQTQCMMGV